MHVVFLSRWYPFPPDNGAKLRIYNLLRQLGRRHDVTLLTFAEPRDRVDGETLGALRQVCRDVDVFPYHEFRPTSRRAVAGLLAPEPRYVRDVYSEDLAQTLQARLAGRRTDVIVSSQLAMMPYPLRLGAWPSVLEELELAVFRDAADTPLRTLSAARARLTWLKLSRYIQRTLPLFDASTVVSEDERRLASTMAPHAPAPYVVPNAVETGAYTDDYGQPEADSIVFSGALTYAPNNQGAQWFLRSVFPRVRQQIPQAMLRITGGFQGVDVGALGKHPGCELTGYVPDVRPVVARSAVAVVPLWTGGGTRLKILESMALGTPIVATTKGAEGLDVSHGENILLADDPTQFAEYVVAVMRSPHLRRHLAAGGRALVRARYDWDVVGPRLCEIVERAAAGRAAMPTGSHA